MPSEVKTSNIGLNQWQGNEYVKREDFVEDNLIIDNEIKSLITEVNTVETLKTEKTTASIQSLNDFIQESPLTLWVEGRTISNAVVNGDFSLGTSGWLFSAGTTSTSVSDSIATFTSTAEWGRLYYTYDFKLGKTYYIEATIKADSDKVALNLNGRLESEVFHSGSGEFEKLRKVVTLTGDAPELRIQDRRTSNWTPIQVQKVMAIDLDQHPHLQDLTAEEINERIPHYIHGTQSADGLMFKSVGKNLFDGKFTMGQINADGTITISTDRIVTQNFIPVKPNTSYTWGSVATSVAYFDRNLQFIDRQTNVQTFTTLNNAHFIKSHFVSTNLNLQTQLEGGTAPTTREPYTEDYAFIDEFMGSLQNGMKNELVGNRLTKNVEKIVLDGSLDVQHWSNQTGYKEIRFNNVALDRLGSNRPVVIKHDKKSLAYGSSSLNVDTISQFIWESGTHLVISVANSDTGWGDNYTPTTDEIRAYFNGWKMYVAGQDASLPYNGTGTKSWAKRRADGTYFEGTLNVPTTSYPEFLANGFNFYQLMFQKATTEYKDLNLNVLTAKKNGHVIVEPWRRHIIKGEDIIDTFNLASHVAVTDTKIFNDAFNFTDGVDSHVFIPNKDQMINSGLDFPHNIGKYSTRSTNQVRFILPRGTTLAETRKLLEGTVIYYKLAPQYSVNPSWQVELDTTLLAQANSNSKAVADVSKWVGENTDLIKELQEKMKQNGYFSGKNEFGEWIAFDDRTLVCSFGGEFGELTTNYVSATARFEIVKPFPISFIDKNYQVIPTLNGYSGNTASIANTRRFVAHVDSHNESQTHVRINVWMNTSYTHTTGNGIQYRYIAIGRWKA